MSKTVDTILTNALVLTMDQEFTQYPSGAIAVQGDSILAVGPADEIAKEYSAKETIDCGGKILMPGLVNAHTHVPIDLGFQLSDPRILRLTGERLLADSEQRHFAT